MKTTVKIVLDNAIRADQEMMEVFFKKAAQNMIDKMPVKDVVRLFNISVYQLEEDDVVIMATVDIDD